MADFQGNLMLSIKQYMEGFIGLLFPRTCCACGAYLSQQEDILCIACEYELPQTNFHLTEDNPVARRFWGRVDVKNATALYNFSKGGKVQHLIHQLKFKGKKEAGLFLGRKLGRQLVASPLYKDIDLVVPLPLHKKRLRQRGYNQCDLFAQGIAEALGTQWQPNVLVRSDFTTSQTKKGRIERWENVKDLFTLNKGFSIEGKNILLVDDVITTGATLEACATALLQANGATVSVATIAMAL